MPEKPLLTEHFSFDELTHTKHTDLLDKNREYARPKLAALKELCALLEEVRRYLNVPLMVSSGVRCPELNARVGGVPTSQHLKGKAADIVPRYMTVEDAFKRLSGSGLTFGQLILERAGRTEWLHVSIPAPGIFNEVFEITKKETV